jgi:hypothetical protein
LVWPVFGGRNRKKVEQRPEVNGGSLKSLPLFFEKYLENLPVSPFTKGGISAPSFGCSKGSSTLTSILSPQGRGRSGKGFFIGRVGEDLKILFLPSITPGTDGASSSQ